MPRALIIGALHADGLALLRAREGLMLEQISGADRAGTARAARDADAILVRTAILDRAAIDGAARLKVVSRHGVGYDNVDLEALTERRIPLALVGGVNALAVAEHVFWLMLACARRAAAQAGAMRPGHWGERDGLGAVELAGRTLLIVGFGRIGRLVARRAKAFDMRVVAHDPFAAVEGDVDAVAADLDDALAAADIVTLHLPFSASTAGLIGRDRLGRMKPGAILLNTARGGLVDEVALAEALRAGRLGAAGFDVFAQEPPPADHPLAHAPNVVLSPHSAALTGECLRRMGLVSAQNLLDGLDGRLDPDLVVNREVLR